MVDYWRVGNPLVTFACSFQYILFRGVRSREDHSPPVPASHRSENAVRGSRSTAKPHHAFIPAARSRAPALASSYTGSAEATQRPNAPSRHRPRMSHQSALRSASSSFTIPEPHATRPCSYSTLGPISAHRPSPPKHLRARANHTPQKRC